MFSLWYSCFSVETHFVRKRICCRCLVWLKRLSMYAAVQKSCLHILWFWKTCPSILWFQRPCSRALWFNLLVYVCCVSKDLSTYDVVQKPCRHLLWFWKAFPSILRFQRPCSRKLQIKRLVFLYCSSKALSTYTVIYNALSMYTVVRKPCLVHVFSGSKILYIYFSCSLY